MARIICETAGKMTAKEGPTVCDTRKAGKAISVHAYLNVVVFETDWRFEACSSVLNYFSDLKSSESNGPYSYQRDHICLLRKESTSLSLQKQVIQRKRPHTLPNPGWQPNRRWQKKIQHVKAMTTVFWTHVAPNE